MRRLHRTKNIKRVVEAAYKLTPSLKRYIGNEIISGFKGLSAKKAIVNREGRVTTRAAGVYPYGISKRRSPDGTPYEPLKESTLRSRKREGISRGEGFILRETDGLYKGLVAVPTPKGVDVRHSSPDDNAKSLLHEEGRSRHPSGLYTSKDGSPVNVAIPARPHRATQKKVLDNIKSAVEQFAAKRR